MSTRLRSWATDVVGLAIGFALGTGAVQAIGGGLGAVPAIDGWLFPVIRFEGVSDIVRVSHNATYTTGRACFALSMTKLRAATPLPYDFWVKARYSPRLGVSAELVDDQDRRLPDQGYGPAHSVGASWARRYCFELPGTISDASEITVYGTAYHQRHPLWTTQTPVPPFTIGPAT